MDADIEENVLIMEKELLLLGGTVDSLFVEPPEQVESLAHRYKALSPLSGYPHRTHEQQKSENGNSRSENRVCDPPGIGSWPRRLVHLPTWTSLEWKPGNRYGNFYKPEYCAISYTWGRYRLDIGKRSMRFAKVKGISIQGTPWAIPPINPEMAFRAENFKAALLATAAAQKRSPAEFVWVDIACIDQRPGEPEGQLEIGRQAAIFRGTRSSTIWLWTLSTKELTRLLNGVVEGFEHLMRLPDDPVSKTMASHENQFRQLKFCLDRLCSDNYFTSLWTLQEAYLCPQAKFISREGAVVEVSGLASLDDLAYIGQRLSVTCRSLISHFRLEYASGPPPWAKYCFNILHIVEEKGFPAISTRNPIVLYSTVSHRKTINELDYIYGIQQVFKNGLRLGCSAEDADQNHKFTRYELQMQLGAQLMQLCPVESQMHVFAEPVEDYCGWCISPSSRVPTGLDWDRILDPVRYRVKAYCDLSTNTVESHVLGSFRGIVATFAAVKRAAKGYRAGGVNYFDNPGLAVALDVVQVIAKDEPLEYRSRRYVRDIPQGEEQTKLTAWLESFYGDSLLVLLLGKEEGSSVRHGNVFVELHAGLLITSTNKVYNELGYWNRIGFCIWQDYQGSDTTFWRKSEGLFG